MSTVPSGKWSPFTLLVGYAPVRRVGLSVSSCRRDSTLPSTGHEATQSGIYQGDDAHQEQIALSKGETFPPCSHCRRAVNWHLVRATTTR